MRKRILVWLCAVTAAFALLAMEVSAANYTGCADSLSQLGLFQGTGNPQDPYELDRAPNRYEAAVMLVRLLGRERQALDENNAHPFTDVPAWAGKHVGYLYQNGLTKGSTATVFGGEACTAQMYAAFVLRAMGYSDAPGGDFMYNGAVVYAQALGLYTAEQGFLRDDAVVMSYGALVTPCKDGELLLEKLVAGGAVDTARAQPLLDRYRTYRALSESTRSLEGAYALDQSVTVDMTIEMQGLSMSFGAENRMQLSTQNGLRYATTMRYTGIMAQPDESYYYDGQSFYQADQDGRMRYQCNEETARLMLPDNSGIMASTPFWAIGDITVATQGGETVYNIRIDAALQTALSEAGGTIGDMGVGLRDFEYTLHMFVRDGVFQRSELTASYTCEMEGQIAHANMKVVTKINGVDAAVTVPGPTDISSYIDGGAI